MLRTNRQTDTQTDGLSLPTPTDRVGMGNDDHEKENDDDAVRVCAKCVRWPRRSSGTVSSRNRRCSSECSLRNWHIATSRTNSSFCCVNFSTSSTRSQRRPGIHCSTTSSVHSSALYNNNNNNNMWIYKAHNVNTQAESEAPNDEASLLQVHHLRLFPLSLPPCFRCRIIIIIVIVIYFLFLLSTPTQSVGVVGRLRPSVCLLSLRLFVCSIIQKRMILKCSNLVQGMTLGYPRSYVVLGLKGQRSRLQLGLELTAVYGMGSNSMSAF